MDNIVNWINLAITILSGLVVCIPIAAQLVKYVKAASKEKNWSQIISIVVGFMTDAEGMFSEGEARKAWVLQKVSVAAKTVDYPYDDVTKTKVSAMIDEIIAASRSLNVAKKAVK